jgi:peptide deformylase
MSEQEIIQLGNPLLREKSKQIVEFGTRYCEDLAQDLSDTLAAFRFRTGYGRGIAAPQIGQLSRMIFIRMPTGFCGPIFNPVIVRSGTDEIELWDDCFSFPDLMVLVRRSLAVSVVYQDERGLDHRMDAEGPLAELLQHEIDHLDGTLAIDRAVSPDALMTRTEWQRQMGARTGSSGRSTKISDFRTPHPV